jgi:hypothetical protein
MDGAVVFLNPDTQLALTNSAIPVLRPDQIKDHVRARVKEAKVPGATQRALLDFLAQKAVHQAEEDQE